MIGCEWLYKPDDDREDWCFLIIDIDESTEDYSHRIAGWRIGYGNPVRMVRTTSGPSNGEVSEREIVKRLLKELQFCRDKGTKVVTVDKNLLVILRTRILLLGLKASLRKVRHICLGDLIERHFAGLKVSEIEDVRAILSAIEKNGGPKTNFQSITEDMLLSEIDRNDGDLDDSKKELIEFWVLFRRIGRLVPCNSIEGEVL